MVRSFPNGNGGRLRRALRVNEELSTTNVELRVGRIVLRRVESQKLSTDQVITCLNVLGDRCRDVAVVFDHLRGGPFPGSLIVSGLPDFEPAVASRIVGSDSTLDFLQVDSSGTLVGRIQRQRL